MKKNIIYIDNHLLVVRKPAGILIQGDNSGDITLLDIYKDYLKEKYNKPGNVYLGLVHRIDRPVSGVVAFARTSKAASRLTDQFRERKTEKIYRNKYPEEPLGEIFYIEYASALEQAGRADESVYGSAHNGVNGMRPVFP